MPTTTDRQADPPQRRRSSSAQRRRALAGRSEQIRRAAVPESVQDVAANH